MIGFFKFYSEMYFPSKLRQTRYLTTEGAIQLRRQDKGLQKVKIQDSKELNIDENSIENEMTVSSRLSQKAAIFQADRANVVSREVCIFPGGKPVFKIQYLLPQVKFVLLDSCSILLRNGLIPDPTLSFCHHFPFGNVPLSCTSKFVYLSLLLNAINCMLIFVEDSRIYIHGLFQICRVVVLHNVVRLNSLCTVLILSRR